MATVKKTKAQIEAEAKKAKAAAAKKTGTTKPVAPVAPTEPVAPVADAGINLQHLTHIVTATTGPAGFCFTPAEVNGPLVAAGLVDIKADVVDANGHIATKANAAGIEYVAKAAGPFGGVAAAAVSGAWTPEVQQAAPAAPAATQHNTAMAVPATRTMTKPPEGGFKVVVGIAPPPLVREFGTRQSVYPFDSMVVGGSFFVAATEQRPKPAKSLASTVNSATARFAVEDGVDGDGNPKFKKTRKFSLRAVAADTTWPDGSTGGAPWGFPGQAGAMVSRIE